MVYDPTSRDRVIPLNEPYSHAVDVTPDDDNDLAIASRALHVITTAGLVDVTTLGGDSISLYIPLGGVIDVRVKRVLESSTAVGIVSLW